MFSNSYPVVQFPDEGYTYVEINTNAQLMNRSHFERSGLGRVHTSQ